MSDVPVPPVVCRDDIVADLRALGLDAGMGLMVHSSLKSFGCVEGGALTVIEALMKVLTPAGTLLLPSFNHGVVFGPRKPGFYDPRETPTSNGAIPDAFWRRAGVSRSLNPTHAFAGWGHRAERYVEHHHRTLTMGPASPLGLLGQEGGRCLLLGVGFQANTFHHVVEMTTGVPCLGLRTEAYPVRLPDGRTVLGRTWGWRAAGCPFTQRGLYHAEMRARGLLREVMIGACRAVCFRLQDCFEIAARHLREGVADIPPCGECPVRPSQNQWSVPSDWDAGRQCLRPDAEALHY